MMMMMMMNKYVAILFVICAYLLNLNYAEIGDFCLTPHQATGQCISLINCDSLFNLLKKRPISSTNADLLRQSQCGFIGTTPKVCCPSSSTSEDSSSSTRTSENTEESYSSSDSTIQAGLLPTTDVCGIGSDNRIYGGEKANLDEYPWMALIEYERPNGNRGFYCGGVLISSKYILTAAHCIKGKDLPPSWKIVSVRLGEYNTDTDEDCIESINGHKECAPPAENVAVEQTIAHENYQPFDANQYNDIALIRLLRDVKFSDYIRPICLPKDPLLQSKSYVNKNLFVAGWGKTENSSESNIKLKLEVPVNNEETCSRTYSSAGVRLRATQICAGGKKGKDSCRGDSGGPLMGVERNGNDINWYSIGVVSFGPTPCGMANWPGVYTKVSSFMPWIQKTIRP